MRTSSGLPKASFLATADVGVNGRKGHIAGIQKQEFNYCFRHIAVVDIDAVA
jgi:hypothetical protein